MREGRRLTGRATGNQEINPRFHLPRHQVAQGSVIDGAILSKRSDQSRTTATELHEIKITLIGVCAKLLQDFPATGSGRNQVGTAALGWLAEQSPAVHVSLHTSLKSKNPFFPESHSAARTAPSANPRRDLES